MWISMDTTKSTNDILQTLKDSRPYEIIAMEGSSTSGKDRMIKLLVMDDDKRKIQVINQDDKDAVINPTEVDSPDPDVYVLSDLDQWDGISANQQALLAWISSVMRNDKTIIITGECLHNRLPTLMDVLRTQYGERFRLYQHRLLSNVGVATPFYQLPAHHVYSFLRNLLYIISDCQRSLIAVTQWGFIPEKERKNMKCNHVWMADFLRFIAANLSLPHAVTAVSPR